MALRNARYKDGGKWVPMTGGKLQIQSEAAEVFYRDIEIRVDSGHAGASTRSTSGLSVGSAGQS